MIILMLLDDALFHESLHVQSREKVHIMTMKKQYANTHLHSSELRVETLLEIEYVMMYELV